MKKEENKVYVVARGNRRIRITLGLTILFLIFIVPIAFAKLSPLSHNYKSVKAEVSVPFDEKHITKFLELPYIADSTYLISCKAGRYTSLYSPKDKQSLWVAYLLTQKDVAIEAVERSNNFRECPTVLMKGWQTAQRSDYKGSSFDRGHLLPSRDRARTTEENSSTFYFSNISPQRARLNRGGWMYLESYVREVAKKYGFVYVVVGVIFDKNTKSYIGENKVTIPKYFYKALLTMIDGKYVSVGFIMPNSEDVKSNYISYITSVNNIEKVTGVDLFTHLADSIEEACELQKQPFKIN
ncbi:MAG: DNA/RNA non-specific endonuclease [Rikenellaceae bacterium]